jgi:hypothetical protein
MKNDTETFEKELNSIISLKSKHDKLGKKYNQIRKKGSLSTRLTLWIRKEDYRDLLYFEVGKRGFMPFTL